MEFPRNGLVLVGEVEGYHLELTDDILNRLKSGDIVYLTRVPIDCEPGLQLGNGSETTLAGATEGPPMIP